MTFQFHNCLLSRDVCQIYHWLNSISIASIYLFILVVTEYVLVISKSASLLIMKLKTFYLSIVPHISLIPLFIYFRFWYVLTYNRKLMTFFHLWFVTITLLFNRVLSMRTKTVELKIWYRPCTNHTLYLSVSSSVSGHLLLCKNLDLSMIKMTYIADKI